MLLPQDTVKILRHREADNGAASEAQDTPYCTTTRQPATIQARGFPAISLQYRVESMHMANQSDSSSQTAKERVAKIAVGAISSVFAIKVVAAILTGSIGILADALHSLIDLSGAFVGYVGVRVAGKPADEDHRFGHGRAEDIAGASIATLIFIAAGTLAYQAIQRLIEGTAIQMLDTGIVATAIAIVINVGAGRFVLKRARSADSVALEATGKHFMADVMGSVAVLIGLILVRTTGRLILDPMVALIVVVLIVRTACGIMRTSISNLMDTRLPEDEERALRESIEGHEEIANYHKLRTRKAGGQRHVVVHIVVSRDYTVEEGHRIAEEIKDEIYTRFPDSTITVHVEPCTPDCAECPTSCRTRQKSPEGQDRASALP